MKKESDKQTPHDKWLAGQKVCIKCKRIQDWGSHMWCSERGCPTWNILGKTLLETKV